MRSTQEIFERELVKREIPFTGPDAEGLYKLQLGDGSLTVCLENISREYKRDEDPGAIERFVDWTLNGFKLPEWERAESLLFLSAEPADHQFGDTICWPISDSVYKVLVLTDLQEGKITWVTQRMLDEWEVSRDTAVGRAADNMDSLLHEKEPEVAGEIDGMALGMVPVDSVFKASTIFAPEFKSFITKKLDWPVLAVIPCRDFIYVLAEKDQTLLNRMGAVVQREYRESGYPITTEVLRISDDGVEAIGKFPE